LDSALAAFAPSSLSLLSSKLAQARGLAQGAMDQARETLTNSTNALEKEKGYEKSTLETSGEVVNLHFKRVKKL
jgi:hypothetical protein